MANKKISQLLDGVTFQTTDDIPLSRAGQNRKVTGQNVVDLVETQIPFKGVGTIPKTFSYHDNHVFIVNDSGDELQLDNDNIGGFAIIVVHNEETFRNAFADIRAKFVGGFIILNHDITLDPLQSYNFNHNGIIVMGQGFRISQNGVIIQVSSRSCVYQNTVFLNYTGSIDIAFRKTSFYFSTGEGVASSYTFQSCQWYNFGYDTTNSIPAFLFGQSAGPRFDGTINLFMYDCLYTGRSGHSYPHIITQFTEHNDLYVSNYNINLRAGKLDNGTFADQIIITGDAAYKSNSIDTNPTTFISDGIAEYANSVLSLGDLLGIVHTYKRLRIRAVNGTPPDPILNNELSFGTDGSTLTIKMRVSSISVKSTILTLM
jgi:hypothetical protein